MRLTNRLEIALSLAIASLLSTTLASAADSPPEIPFGKTASNAAIASQLPTTGSFYATFDYDNPVIEGTLYVWPNAEQACSQGHPDPARDTKQTYVIPIVVTTASDGKATGKALVPHLQVDEIFCFEEYRLELGAPSAATFAQTVAAAVDKPAADVDDAKRHAQNMLEAAAKGFCDISTSPGAAGPTALARCEAIDTKPLERELVEAGKPVLSATKQQEDDTASLKRFEAETYAPLKEDAKKLADAIPANTGKLHDFLKAPTDAPDDLKAAESALADAVKKDPKFAKEKAIREWFGKWSDATKKRGDLNAKVQDDLSKLATAISNAKKDESALAVAFFKEKLRKPVAVPPRKLQAHTADFNNYVSPELGIGVGVPFVRGAHVTLIPYTAVNLYFTPVERSLDMKQLVHSTAQRVSLTFGLSLSKSLGAREIDLGATVADQYGIVGLGYRVLPFARIAALLLFADAKPTGGLSRESTLVTAGALSVSADLDVISFLTAQLKK